MCKKSLLNCMSTKVVDYLQTCKYKSGLTILRAAVLELIGAGVRDRLVSRFLNSMTERRCDRSVLIIMG